MLGAVLVLAQVAAAAPPASVPVPAPERYEARADGSAVPIRSWEAPRFYRAPAVPTAGKAKSPGSPETLSSTPLTFVAVTPCRILDTRGFTPPDPAYGAPALDHLLTREFVVAGKCGIPAGARAVSANATIVAPAGAGYLALWEGTVGASWPGNSTMNFSAGAVLANAAIVPLSDFGTINARAYVPTGSGTTDFILDVNGYYEADPTGGPFIKYTLGTSTSFSPGSYRAIPWDLSLAESADAAGLVTTSPTFKFQAPKAGVYEVTARLSLVGIWGSTAGFVGLSVDLGGGLPLARMGGSVIPANSDSYTVIGVDGTAFVVLGAADQIFVSFVQTSTSSLNTTCDETNCWLTIRFVRPMP